MLTYLINVTGDLFAVSLVIGVMLAFLDRFTGDRGKAVFRGGIALGLVIAAVRAYITNTRRLVGGWKVGAYGYGAALALFVLWAVAYAVYSRRALAHDPETHETTRPELILSAVSGLLVASYLYGAVPNVFVYPFKFDTGGNGILSTDYLFRLGGYLLGILLCVVSAAAACRIVEVALKKGYKTLACALFVGLNVMYAVYDFARLMLVLTPRKIVNSITMFKFAAASNNHSHWYTWAAFLALLAAAVFLWARSKTQQEPYATKAEHRKQRAVWRTGKRSTVVLSAGFVMAVLCATWFVKLNTVVIREAPVEDPIIAGDELQVPLEMVADGHLHRFGYQTPEGNLVRFIVVLKQENTNNYGVGLDACDICGEAGYYENNDGQVVCKKCNVVMNRSTIGMKGGCNPIIIEYDINESYITVPIEEMVKNQNRFKL